MPSLLEIKRTSITRLKPSRVPYNTYPGGRSLKSKEPRLRDWNTDYLPAWKQRRSPWNQKNLDYEIETRPQGTSHLCSIAWNQKNLDYEIETGSRLCLLYYIQVTLEIKRTSITRLKHCSIAQVRKVVCHLKSKEPRLRDWNAIRRISNKNVGFILKSKEPRLRDWNRLLPVARRCRCRLKSKEPRLRDWNTGTVLIVIGIIFAWNQKNLDYEIETAYRCIQW